MSCTYQIRSPLNRTSLPLIELQKMDLRIAEIKEQRRKIPERLEVNEAPLREAKRIVAGGSGPLSRHYQRAPLATKRISRRMKTASIR